MLTQHLLLLSPEQDLETIKQTNLGQLGGGTTKDEGRRTNDLGASAAVVPASKQIFCLLSIAVAGVTGEGWSTLLGFSSRVSAVGLSKVHLPWLRHRNIPQACNDNISRPYPPHIPENLLLYIPCILHIYPCPRGVGKLKLGCSLKPSGVCCVPFSFCGVDETLMTLRTHSRGKRQQGPCVQLRFLPLFLPRYFSAQFHFEANEDKAG